MLVSTSEHLYWKKTAFSSLSQRYLNLHLKISYLNEKYLSCRFQHVDKIKVNYISHTLIPYCSECKTARYIKFLNLKSLFWCRSGSFLKKCLCSLIKSSSLSVSFALHPALRAEVRFSFIFSLLRSRSRHCHSRSWFYTYLEIQLFTTGTI